MRIAIITTLASGGATNGALRITRALIDYGHVCSFFILEPSGNSFFIPLLDNDDSFWIPALFKRWSALTTPEILTAAATDLFSDNTTVPNIPSFIHEDIINADIILFRWVAGIIFSPSLLSAISGKNIVWVLPDTYAFTGGCHYTGDCCSFQTECRNCYLLNKPGYNDASAKCFHLKEQIYPLLNPTFITPSTWLADKAKNSTLLKTYPITTIPHPLDITTFKPPQNRSDLRKKLDLPDDVFIIMSGCEHLDNQRKNIKMFYEALTILYEQSPELPIIIMLYGHGQSPELAFPVQHFGYIENETRMAELYGAADLFIHTALQEAFGLTLCEAQACGTPTLCFAVGGCPETMIPGETGFVVAETTSQALAEKLRSIIDDRDSLCSMRQASRAFAEKRFNPHTIAATYTKIFQKTLVAPGLKINNPLYAELTQNQIASLASFLYGTEQEQNLLKQKHNSLIKEHNALREEFNILRWNLQHPLRWFFGNLYLKFIKRYINTSKCQNTH